MYTVKAIWGFEGWIEKTCIFGASGPHPHRALVGSLLVGHLTPAPRVLALPVPYLPGVSLGHQKEHRIRRHHLVLTQLFLGSPTNLSAIRSPLQHT